MREIKVETYPGIIERVADAAKFRPQRRGTADHNLPVCLAMALLDGDVTVTQFEKDRWRDSDVTALVEKTSVKSGEALIARCRKVVGRASRLYAQIVSHCTRSWKYQEGTRSGPYLRPR
jgi:2-methylcitrate dehydratase